jgi:PleD family two-component response regulator
MVYGFARQSGGHMGIYSEQGKGCVVRLYLPTAEDGETSPEVSLEPPRDQKGRGERILVIEDDPAVRATTVGMLHDLGYKVVEAGTGAEALGEIDKGSDFDMVFTDVFCPAA